MPATLSLSDRLARGIIDTIHDEHLKPGDPLPTVRDLALRFEVTPPTIREALRRLQATDSVVLRHGSGIYVGQGIDRSLLPNPNGARLTTGRMLSLIEARLTIEPGIAALAASNRTSEHIEDLTAASVNAVSDRAHTPARNFHRDVATASGNPMLFEVIDALLYVHGDEQRQVRRMIEDRDREHSRHTAIVAAIADQDSQAAQHLMRLHLEELLAEAREKLAGHTPEKAVRASGGSDPAE